MKQIVTLFTVLLLAVSASQAQSGSNKPYVSPNPATNFIKVNWTQNLCDNVRIELSYMNGTVAKVLVNQQYCDGIYCETLKVNSFVRGPYILTVRIGTQKWSYKILLV